MGIMVSLAEKCKFNKYQLKKVVLIDEYTELIWEFLI